MKNIIYISIAAICMLCIGWAYYAYGHNLPVYSRSVWVTVFGDKTDILEIKPSGSDILKVTGLSDNKWESVHLVARSFSQFKFSNVYTVDLPGKLFLLGNPVRRNKEISDFEGNVDSIFNVINRPEGKQAQSSIYAPFIQEINRVATSKADIKIAIAYSDVCENTTEFSIYLEKDRTLLKKHPEKIAKLLAHHGKPGDLHGTTIYLLFQPKNGQDEEYFACMSEFYKTLFESAGAKVYIGTNLIVDKS